MLLCIVVLGSFYRVPELMRDDAASNFKLISYNKNNLLCKYLKDEFV